MIVTNDATKPESIYILPTCTCKGLTGWAA